MKNFVDFIKDASQSGSPLAKKFFDELNKPGATAKGLHDLFGNLGYKDVSREDCEKILSFPKELVVGIGQKY